MMKAHSGCGKRRDIKGQVLERTWTDEAVGGGESDQMTCEHKMKGEKNRN